MEIKIQVDCPRCRKSLMNDSSEVDNLSSIQVLAKVRDKLGTLYLSQIYGSYNKIFDGVDDIADSIVECSCPHCMQPFPIQGECKCDAPIILFNLQVGGNIKICTRNGCTRHSLEFEDINNAFRLL